jgi:hypothetical protein
MVYLDDIIVYSQSYEEHLKHLRLVFERLQTRPVLFAPKMPPGGKEDNIPRARRYRSGQLPTGTSPSKDPKRRRAERPPRAEGLPRAL